MSVAVNSRHVTDDDNVPVNVAEGQTLFAVDVAVSHRTIGWILSVPVGATTDYEAYTEAGKYIGFTSTRTSAQRLVVNQARI